MSYVKIHKILIIKKENERKTKQHQKYNIIQTHLFFYFPSNSTSKTSTQLASAEVKWGLEDMLSMTA